MKRRILSIDEFVNEQLQADKLAEEQAILEGTINSDEEFKSWAEEKLKKMHGDSYDQAKADEVITGLLKKKSDDGLDYGAIIGMLNK
ncbi:MAG: hypothetical protein WC979_01440 [Candidatus Pacearchaeota archaeon]|jgi:hypothetical protein|nr:hypothetical protein [Clostridia bacterium]